MGYDLTVVALKDDAACSQGEVAGGSWPYCVPHLTDQFMADRGSGGTAMVCAMAVPA